MRRYDLYGFNHLTIEESKLFIEESIGIRFEMRDSSYRGIYYISGLNSSQGFMLQSNDEGSRWYKEYPWHYVTLMVNDLPGMDQIRTKLTSDKKNAVFLRTIVVEDQ